MTSFQPRNDLVLIQPDEAAKMRGRLHVPSAYVHVPTRGTVIAVGPGYLLADGTRAAPDLGVGDRVEFALQPGDAIRMLDGCEHFLLKETQVLAIVADEPLPDVAGLDEDAATDLELGANARAALLASA